MHIYIYCIGYQLLIHRWHFVPMIDNYGKLLYLLNGKNSLEFFFVSWNTNFGKFPRRNKQVIIGYFIFQSNQTGWIKFTHVFILNPKCYSLGCILIMQYIYIQANYILPMHYIYLYILYFYLLKLQGN